jgi:hypothetical protein
MITIDLLKPKDFIKGLKALNKIRDKQNSKDIISWTINKYSNKLIISMLADSGTLVHKSFDVLYQGNTLKLCTNLTTCLEFTCNNNDAVVKIIIKDDMLYIAHVAFSQVSTKLLDVSKYYIMPANQVQTDNIKYFNLKQLKKIVQSLDVKDSNNCIGIDINNNMLSIITNDVNVNLVRCK